MNKKYVVAILSLVLAVNISWGQNTKPNFVIILADDLGYADLGYTGSTQIKTPNIDKLAQGGINFTNGYVSGPVCSPSRAGMLTGRNQVTFGHDNNLPIKSEPGYREDFNGLPLTETTFAERLQKLGYTNGLMGKWHLGYGEHFHPLKRGFDEMWGFLGGGHDYFTSEDNGIEKFEPIQSNFKTPQPITYITDDIGDESVDFIKRHKNKPFFLYASFNAPHAPMQATQEDLELYKHIKNKKRQTYCAMVHRLDVNVGRIMKALEEQGVAENTLVIFLSDNGGPCDHNGSINAPFNGQKALLLEGGIRVPFVMHWKGKLPAGKVYDNPVISLDFAPTFLELAGGEISDEMKFDGVNLMPFLLGENNGKPHESFNWRFTISAAIREGNWKLVRLPDRLPMLFDLSKDISEQNNVAMDNLDVTKSLLKKLGDWDVAQPHPVFMEGYVWKSRQLKLYDVPYKLEQPK